MRCEECGVVRRGILLVVLEFQYEYLAALCRLDLQPPASQSNDRKETKLKIKINLIQRLYPKCLFGLKKTDYRPSHPYE